MWKNLLNIFINNHLPKNNICENDLFLMRCHWYVTAEKIKCWMSANVETDKKWTEFYSFILNRIIFLIKIF